MEITSTPHLLVPTVEISAAEDDMEISSDAGRVDDEIDIDIDLNEYASHDMFDDYMLEDIRSDPDPDMLQQQGEAINDDIMFDEDVEQEDGIMQDDYDDRLSDIGRTSPRNESLSPARAVFNPINETGGAVIESLQKESAENQSSNYFEDPQAQQDYEPQTNNNTQVSLSLPSPSHVKYNDVESNEVTYDDTTDNLDAKYVATETFTETRAQEVPDLDNGAREFNETESTSEKISSSSHLEIGGTHAECNDADGHILSKSNENESYEDQVLLDQEDDTYEDDPSMETPFDHSVIIVYQGSEISLFPDKSDTFFLEDRSLAQQSISNLLQACRQVLGETIGEEEELEIGIWDLGLSINEESLSASTISFAELLHIYVQLQRNSGAQDIEPLYVVLITKIRVSSRLNVLRNAVKQAKRLSQLPFLANSDHSDGYDFDNSPDNIEANDDRRSEAVQDHYSENACDEKLEDNDSVVESLTPLVHQHEMTQQVSPKYRAVESKQILGDKHEITEQISSKYPIAEDVEQAPLRPYDYTAQQSSSGCTTIVDNVEQIPVSENETVTHLSPNYSPVGHVEQTPPNPRDTASETSPRNSTVEDVGRPQLDAVQPLLDTIDDPLEPADEIEDNVFQDYVVDFNDKNIAHKTCRSSDTSTIQGDVAPFQDDKKTCLETRHPLGSAKETSRLNDEEISSNEEVRLSQPEDDIIYQDAEPEKEGFDNNESDFDLNIGSDNLEEELPQDYSCNQSIRSSIANSDQNEHDTQSVNESVQLSNSAECLSDQSQAVRVTTVEDDNDDNYLSVELIEDEDSVYDFQCQALKLEPDPSNANSSNNSLSAESLSCDRSLENVQKYEKSYHRTHDEVEWSDFDGALEEEDAVGSNKINGAGDYDTIDYHDDELYPEPASDLKNKALGKMESPQPVKRSREKLSFSVEDEDEDNQDKKRRRSS